MPTHRPIPVIDLFAGPGGLSEGFSALGRSDGAPAFRTRLSIEKDPSAHRTLELRAFFRQFEHGTAPADYYRHLRDEINREELFSTWAVAAASARKETWLAELGKSDAADVRKRIHDELGAETGWVLIGGPPCQAYSSVGRSRNKGNKDYVPENDHKQYLYVEYLQILADHRPAIFVMENVKGLLSATLKSQLIFRRILEDLRAPAEAIRRAGRPCASLSTSGYCIFSLEQPTMFGDGDLSDFLVRAECHGIPQARHRIILLGIREDLPASAPAALPMRETVPARSVLEGLPRLRSGLSTMPV